MRWMIPVLLPFLVLLAMAITGFEGAGSSWFGGLLGGLVFVPIGFWATYKYSWLKDALLVAAVVVFALAITMGPIFGDHQFFNGLAFGAFAGFLLDVTWLRREHWIAMAIVGASLHDDQRTLAWLRKLK